MRVYLLWEMEPYESSEVLGIYSTREQAEQEYTRLKANNRDQYVYYNVEEREVL